MTGYIDILICLVVVFAVVEFVQDHFTRKNTDQDI